MVLHKALAKTSCKLHFVDADAVERLSVRSPSCGLKKHVVVVLNGGLFVDGYVQREDGCPRTRVVPYETLHDTLNREIILGSEALHR